MFLLIFQLFQAFPSSLFCPFTYTFPLLLFHVLLDTVRIVQSYMVPVSLGVRVTESAIHVFDTTVSSKQANTAIGGWSSIVRSIKQQWLIVSKKAYRTVGDFSLVVAFGSLASEGVSLGMQLREIVFFLLSFFVTQHKVKRRPRLSTASIRQNHVAGYAWRCCQRQAQHLVYAPVFDQSICR